MPNDELKREVSYSEEEKAKMLEAIASLQEIKREDLPMSAAEEKERLRELLLLAQRSFLSHTRAMGLSSYPSDIVKEASNLSYELVSLRDQVNELQKEAVTNEQLKAQLGEVAATAGRAVERGQDLSAKVLIPKPEDMAVRLVPSDSLDRLEEYRTDENVAYLLVGLFGGAVLGILSNWAMNEQFVITRFSAMLMGLFGVLTVLGIYWAFRLRGRVNKVKGRIFHQGEEQATAKNSVILSPSPHP